MGIDRFPNDTLEKLQWYVYRLVDPTTNETFYVGKGQDNRVFQHTKGRFEIADDDIMSSKLETIRRILDAGLEVRHVIHRHGMSEDTAFEVEAALIDAYPNLTNTQGGHGSLIRGPMTAEGIVELYTREEAIFKHKLIVIDVSRSFGRRKGTKNNLLDAVRFMWRLRIRRAEGCDYVLAQRGGMILGVFRPERWRPATLKYFPEFAEDIYELERRGGPKRIGFVGHEVHDPAVVLLYKDKRIPSKLRQAPRAACRYVNM